MILLMSYFKDDLEVNRHANAVRLNYMRDTPFS